MINVNRGHVEYIRNLQKVRQLIQLDTVSEQSVMEWITADALLDSDNRQPAYWDINGSVFIEYQDSRERVDRMTFQRYISRMCVDTYEAGMTESGINSVVAKFIGIMAYKDRSFKVLEGDELVAAYTDNIESGNGCMRGTMSSLTNWYTENNVKMLVWKNKARALLWETDCGETFVDRIYPNDGPHIFEYHMWAAENNAWVRRQNYADAYPAVRPFKGNTERWDFEVTMAVSKSGLYPWMDTFNMTNDHPDDYTEMLMQTAHAGEECDHNVQSTGGTVFGDSYRCTACSGLFLHEKIAGGYCESCREDMVECECCERMIEEDDSCIIQTSHGEEVWCDNCSYNSNALRCVHGCDTVTSSSYPCDDWHQYPSGRYSCPDCLENVLCVSCGDPAEPSRHGVMFYRSIDGSTSRVRSMTPCCSRDCVSEHETRVVELLESLTVEQS